jgi:hypothetical protein
MNGGSDTQAEGSDTDYQSTAKRRKMLESPAEIAMIEESGDDPDHEPETDLSDSQGLDKKLMK